MSLRNALDSALETVPDCRAICYVDLSTGLVLASSLRIRLPQEHLDRVAQVGADLVDKCPDNSAIVTLFARNDLFAFTRLDGNADHMLCYDCGAHCDHDMITKAISQSRKQIAAALQ